MAERGEARRLSRCGAAVALACVALTCVVLYEERRIARVESLVTGGRIAQLQAQVKPALEWNDDWVACALAEAYILEHGWDGHSGATLGGFRFGALTRGADRGALHVGFALFSDAGDYRGWYGGEACFRRGSDKKWYVEDIRYVGEGSSNPPCPL